MFNSLLIFFLYLLIYNNIWNKLLVGFKFEKKISNELIKINWKNVIKNFCWHTHMLIISLILKNPIKLKSLGDETLTGLFVYPKTL